MIKLVIFDLDGVLIDLKECHYESLNSALELISEKYKISIEEHYKCYDGLPTKDKLKLLTKYKNLSTDHYSEIIEKKQRYTMSYIYDKINESQNITETLTFLKKNGYKICVASNSISNTIYSVLTKLKVLHMIDHVISNQDVKHSKPNPEIYHKAFNHFGILPNEALIIEDSPYGLEAAHQSGANVLRVNNSKDINIQNIDKEIKNLEFHNSSYKWKDRKMNVLIPMAGAGSRFETSGYALPKPLIDVNGKPMIHRVIENINVDANFIFIVQKKHEEKFCIKSILKYINKDCQIIEVNSLTEGAACTALLAEKFINNDESLLIVNSDQMVEWDSNRFYYQVSSQTIDASIVTFEATNPKWSFVKLDDNNNVVQVAEKNQISNIATVGIYFWKKGSDFCKYAKQMISKKIRVNNEFYIAPVFNEAILDKKIISTYNIQKMWGLGTPEDLEIYINHNKD